MPLTVGDEILCEIGRIAVYQSHIEGQMAIFVVELLGLDEAKGNIVTSRLSFGVLRDTLQSLLWNRVGCGHRHFSRFEELGKQMNKLEQKRNQFVHSMWGYGLGLTPGAATRVKRVKDRLQSATITLRELKDVVASMEQLEWAISDLRVKVCHHER